MEKKFNFMSSTGRYIVARKWFEEEKEPIAVVQLVHGMQEHIGRYADFANFLASMRLYSSRT